MDRETLNIILEDSLIKISKEKYDKIFIPFYYQLLKNFYCEDNGSKSAHEK